MQFNKNRRVCLSQSNARKYIRQYKLVNQRNVPVTKIVVPEKVSLADGLGPRAILAVHGIFLNHFQTGQHAVLS